MDLAGAAFVALAVLGLASALLAVTRRHAIYSALHLVGFFLSIGGLFFLLRAPFLGTMEILVYAGAIMVLFLFVITMLNLVKGGPLELHVGADPRRGSTWLAAAAAAGLFVFLARAALAFAQRFPDWPARAESFGDVATVGRWVYRDFALHFEVVGLLILAGVVGAAVIVRGLRKS